MSEVIFQWHTTSTDIKVLEEAVLRATKKLCKSILILACDNNKISADTYNQFLTSLDVTVFGGIYPKLTFDSQLLDTGFVIIGFNNALDVHNFLNINQSINDDNTMALEIELYTSPSTQSYFIFYDTFTDNSETFIDALFYSLGNVKIIGGGAGSLDFTQKPCIFSNQGLLQNTCQLVSINTPLHINISHGWRILKGPYLVTSSNNKKIYTLNYEPALKVYKKALGIHDNEITENEFFRMANRFPLGIQGAGSELLVRDIIKNTHNNLESVGDIPVSSMVYILTGDTKSLTSAIDDTKELNKYSLPNEIENLFMVNCVSRYLYLANDFYIELNGILNKYPSKNKMFGVLSMGEVTNSFSGAIKLLNRTTVLGAF